MMINIQDEAMKIHSQYGTTEKANYELQLLAERYAKEYHESEVEKLDIGDVRLLCPFCESDKTVVIEAVSDCVCDECGKDFKA